MYRACSMGSLRFADRPETHTIEFWPGYEYE
jgi:hypothetical protein